MSAYQFPCEEVSFVVNRLAGLNELAGQTGFEMVSEELSNTIINEAGRWASAELAPTNSEGDQHGATIDENGVHTLPSFIAAYQQYVDGGWQSLPCDAQYGGQELPIILSTCIAEAIQGANMAFSLCPMLTGGAIEAIHAHASDKLKAEFLPNMISGKWSGTMNLTEPQAGSDLAAITSRAVPEKAHYRINGQKIFITWGDHDMTDNIIHLVLARLPDAPEGVKGISLFLVPKYLPSESGSYTVPNDVKCVSLEHKLGIHASPTCVMSFGEEEGAIGYLVGEKHQGLACMFTMMNRARLGVGLQGVAIAERAFQHALHYAQERVQGYQNGERVAIIKHADVQRMLMTMQGLTEAARAITYTTYIEADKTQIENLAVKSSQRVDLMTPIVKAWCTEVAQEVTSLGIQIHGGMGFIEETGAAQFYRDARILPIYEGTTGIQAIDLIKRKLLKDNARAFNALIEEMSQTCKKLNTFPELKDLQTKLQQAIDALEKSAVRLMDRRAEVTTIESLATDFLMLCGYITGGWLLIKSSFIALKEQEGSSFQKRKLATTRFYCNHLLSRYKAHYDIICNADIHEFMLDVI